MKPTNGFANTGKIFADSAKTQKPPPHRAQVSGALSGWLSELLARCRARRALAGTRHLKQCIVFLIIYRLLSWIAGAVLVSVYFMGNRHKKA
ncbi:MAG: hypothetical protein IJS87_08630 [Rhodocyclaceae bacterium]|nr:hypothetical protein [Rhodocyclaceae bacterium]